MIVEFEGEVIYWRGPSPFYFVVVPDEPSSDIKAIANRVTYGWGVIPVEVRVGQTRWTTSLFPKDGRYLVPIKNVIRKAEHLEEGEIVSVTLEIQER